ncbi:MAG: hypothetical protein CMJ75_13555 [Planctomycetaceae bacterium]|nr:hypothetical protein [Planctomycetaceae bacterium]
MWQLDGTIATWQCEHLTAQLDLLAPQAGVQVQRWQRQPIDPEPVLQLNLRNPSHAALLDAYIRVGDLIVQYPECPDTGYKLHLRWSAFSEPPVAGVELLVTIHTTRLSITSSLDIGSQFDRSLCQGYTATGLPVAASTKQTKAGTPCGLVLCRPIDIAWTYAEMTAAHGATLRDVARPGNPPHDCHGLRVFNGTLEKGVTRRMCIRGMFLPRTDDTAQATAYFHRFRKTPPQLDS